MLLGPYLTLQLRRRTSGLKAMKIDQGCRSRYFCNCPIKPNTEQFILSIFINLYMFRATMRPSSGETTVFIRLLVLFFCVDDCLVCRSICSCIPDSNQHRITSTKCRINTVVSPDDGPIVARIMQRLINILRINCSVLGFIGQLQK